MGCAWIVHGVFAINLLLAITFPARAFPLPFPPDALDAAACGLAPLEEGRRATRRSHMAETPVLEAVARAGVGKGAARSARREGYVPGVIYGGGEHAAADQRQVQHAAEAAEGGPIPVHADQRQGRRPGQQRDLPRRAARRGQGLADPCRLPAPHRAVADRALHPGRVHQPRQVTGPEARRRADRGAPRGRADGDRGRHPEKLVVDLAGIEINDTIHISTSRCPPAPRRRSPTATSSSPTSRRRRACAPRRARRSRGRNRRADPAPGFVLDRARRGPTRGAFVVWELR